MGAAQSSGSVNKAPRGWRSCGWSAGWVTGGHGRAGPWGKTRQRGRPSFPLRPLPPRQQPLLQTPPVYKAPLAALPPSPVIETWGPQECGCDRASPEDRDRGSRSLGRCSGARKCTCARSYELEALCPPRTESLALWPPTAPHTGLSHCPNVPLWSDSCGSAVSSGAMTDNYGIPGSTAPGTE